MDLSFHIIEYLLLHTVCDAFKWELYVEYKMKIGVLYKLADL